MDLLFSWKYCDFPQCQTNPYFNRSTKIHLEPNRYDLWTCAVTFLFPSNFKKMECDQGVSVCKCNKDDIFGIFFSQVVHFCLHPFLSKQLGHFKVALKERTSSDRKLKQWRSPGLVSKILGSVLKDERTDGDHLQQRQRNSMAENRGGMGADC